MAIHPKRLTSLEQCSLHGKKLIKQINDSLGKPTRLAYYKLIISIVPRVPIFTQRGRAHQWNDLLLRLVDAKSWIWICSNGTWLQTTASDRNIPQTLEQIMGKGSDLSWQMQNITNIVCNNGVWVQCEPPDCEPWHWYYKYLEDDLRDSTPHVV